MTEIALPPRPASRPTRRRALALICIGGAGLAAGCAPTPSGPPVATATEPAVGADALVTAVGAFEGRSDHVTSGGARVVRSGGQWVIELGEDFFFDGAPDPRIGLGNDGYVPGTLLSPLRANEGRQAYALRPDLDIGDYTEVWLWCERFSVPLGVAPLTLV